MEKARSPEIKPAAVATERAGVEMKEATEEEPLPPEKKPHLLVKKEKERLGFNNCYYCLWYFVAGNTVQQTVRYRGLPLRFIPNSPIITGIMAYLWNSERMS